MTSTQMSGSSSVTTADSAVQAPTAYMLTLCRLASPASIKPPQAPQLKKFKFFTSRARHSDGNELRYLHMGYFATVTEAQNWAQLMRRAYPQAIATPVPAALLNHPNSGVPTLQPMQGEPAPLTDTQVMNILEGRSVTPLRDDGEHGNSSDISLLRPEDTNTRRILKDAVSRNAPVSFALQLSWSVQPIEVSTVPLVSIFRNYLLYRTESRREGRSWHSLRLGFFQDAISAKQIAAYVRSSFASVAVMPVTEQERTHASANRIDTTALADTFGKEFDRALHSAPGAPPAKSSTERATPAARKQDRTLETLEQTLELLAASEIWDGNEDSHTDTGVRHLKIQVQKS